MIDKKNIQTSSYLLEKYEQLRSQAYSDNKLICSPGLGLDLFINRGMCSWMNTWELDKIVVQKSKCDSSNIMSSVVSNELVHIITNMIFSQGHLEAFNV